MTMPIIDRKMYATLNSVIVGTEAKMMVGF